MERRATELQHPAPWPSDVACALSVRERAIAMEMIAQSDSSRKQVRARQDNITVIVVRVDPSTTALTAS